MAAPLVTPDDFEDRLNETYEPDERAALTVLCDDTSGLIRNRRPLIDQWIADGELDPKFVTSVAFQVASRVVATVGLGGIALRSETQPEHAYQLTDAALAGLWLTREEMTLLTPTPAERPSRAFSIQPR